MPKVSVIMPVYNTKEEYLREAIESILNQTFSDWELVIIDDVSDTYVQKIVSSYSDERIKYYRKEMNSGAAETRNVGLYKARGEYIALLDSDDIALPQRLEKQVKYLDKHKEIGCLGTNFNTLKKQNKELSCAKIFNHEEIEKYLVFVGCAFCNSTVMLRREILNQYHIQYKSEYVPAEDYELWTQLIGKTKFAIIEEVLNEYRWHENNISQTQRNIQLEHSYEIIIKSIEDYCQISIRNKESMKKFLYGNFDKNTFKQLQDDLLEIINILKKYRFSQPDIEKTIGKRFKKIFYKTKTLSGQLNLLTSPLNKELKISIWFRLFCFITRGLL